MLEFHMSTFDKLYKAAEIMNINVLTKLLDAQRKLSQVKTGHKRKLDDVISSSISLSKVAKAPPSQDLPPALPGRKLPVWKRKIAPVSHQSSHADNQDRWSSDSPMVHDSTPKPTRFEWPDDDLPPLTLMDSTFEEISYTSKPLLTQEEEIRSISNAASSSNTADDARQTSPSHSKVNVSKIKNDDSKEGKLTNKIESSDFEESKYF